ncbi:hypothetical protein BDA99DRAFT_436426 [Phascolomyces articulosus]|uniref:NAD(P)-binding protein n=1 Tax=Phascolomyces articulosus TaxID=60185 RepID=A0AAD5PH59_9FUNG|nr:hypothetical protein BDA99DRAFT_436426 [Phascolomyces articulosus]
MLRAAFQQHQKRAAWNIFSKRFYAQRRLEKKNVFITGASSGIGESTAREFAKEGSNLVHIILTARRLDRLDALKEELKQTYKNIDIHTLKLDVRKKKNVDDAIASLPSSVKDNISVLVNNAGLVLGMDPLLDVTEEEYDTMMDTNVKGLMFVTQAILPRMIEQNEGHIINIGSVAGKQSYQNGSIYCASKHAVDAITRALLYETMSTPVRVSQICPGMVNTEFSTVRFHGDKEKADSVYAGMEPLVGQDIAELITFIASRPPHVNIVDTLVFPTAQADARTAHRKQ